MKNINYKCTQSSTKIYLLYYIILETIVFGLKTKINLSKTNNVQTLEVCEMA